MTTQVHMSAELRRASLVDAAVAAIREHGMLETTSRHVTAAAGVSAGLLHHYFESFDDLLAAAFEQVALEDLQRATDLVSAQDSPSAALDALVVEFEPARDNWMFQWWMDAWSSSARHPAVRATAARLNLAWQQLFERVISAGVATGEFTCDDPRAAAWRLLALLDGLTIQLVAHSDGPGREDVMAWTRQAALRETGRSVPGDGSAGR